MVQLTAKLGGKDTQVLGRSMTARIGRIAQAEEQARKAAAITATKVTQGHFRYIRPANAPSRLGRPSTQGRFTSFLQWKAKPGPQGGVNFDTGEADAKVRYWIIMEIGTGEKATLRAGGMKNPQGRPAKGSTYVRTVKAQRGRRISAGLAFGTGPRGTFTPPGASRGQQLYLRSQLKRAPLLPLGRRQGLFIHREIKGQHFVREGGEAGFREYRTTVLAAARRTFAGKGYRP